MDIILKSLVYPLEAGRVLLLHRSKDPFSGLWAAPGGKVDVGESPYEAGLRELREETGYQTEKLILRGIVTIVSQETGETTVHFLYACNEYSGELIPETEEGRASWQHLHRVFDLPMPETYHRLLTYAINLTLPLVQARIVADVEGRVMEIKEF
jgi:8-oxo-dGTP pyrophosphatase MutT (NUDIX family)